MHLTPFLTMTSFLDNVTRQTFRHRRHTSKRQSHCCVGPCAEKSRNDAYLVIHSTPTKNVPFVQFRQPQLVFNPTIYRNFFLLHSSEKTIISKEKPWNSKSVDENRTFLSDVFGDNANRNVGFILDLSLHNWGQFTGPSYECWGPG